MAPDTKITYRRRGVLMEKYKTDNIQFLPFPEDIKLDTGDWYREWTITLPPNKDIDIKSLSIIVEEQSSSLCNARLINAEERVITIGIRSTFHTASPESIGTIQNVIWALIDAIGSIDTVQGMPVSSWPIFSLKRRMDSR